jgi:branched-chain amino acid transport system substrate-binding protein
MRLSRLGVLGAGVVIVAAACTGGASTAPSEAPSAGASAPASAAASAGSPSGDKGTIVLKSDLPLEGADLAGSDPVRKGIRLALDQAGSVAGGFTITYDDSGNNSKDGQPNPDQGALNATAMVQQTDLFAFVGPMNSGVARTQIPITNEAGLLQCSPANTNPDLTKPPVALTLRSAFPERINYVRVATTDDLQGPANAQYAYNTLGAKNMYILDDTTVFGKGIADQVDAEWKKLGGTVVGREAVPESVTDYTSIMTDAKAASPDVLYWGGLTSTGGPRLLNAAIQVGLDVPFVGPDGIHDGPGSRADSFLSTTGANAAKAYSSLAGVGSFPGKTDFDAAYQALHGEAATGYAYQGHACTQIILDALNRVGDQFQDASDMNALRIAVAAAASDPSVTYDTVLGEVQFDENGDTSQKVISIYKVDVAADGGKGDWVLAEEIRPVG